MFDKSQDKVAAMERHLAIVEGWSRKRPVMPFGRICGCGGRGWIWKVKSDYLQQWRQAAFSGGIPYYGLYESEAGVHGIPGVPLEKLDVVGLGITLIVGACPCPICGHYSTN